MASLVRYSALAAFISAVSGYAIGEFPTQTVGYGEPFSSEPTEAPSMELVKKSLGKRAVTNTCTEWTIPGGFGQPVCYNSETCLFTSATDGFLYEGCGQTSIAYNWITECWPYPQIGTAPISQIYCPASAPDCGFFAFQFDDYNTYYNFGCSTVSYSLYVDLISTTDASASQTVTLAGGGTVSITETAPATVTDTVGPGTSTPVVIPGLRTGTATSQPASASSSTNLPTVNSHSSKSTPIGGIVGGVVGGIAVIALVAFLLWFVLRKRRQDKAETQAHESQVQQQQADAATAAAFHNKNRVSEIAGTMKPVPQAAGAFAPVTYTGQENGNANEKLMAQQVNEYPSPTPQSPPPMYAQPHQPQQQAPASPYPPSNYTELENQNLQPGSERTSVQPVSPVGTGTGTFSTANELSGSNAGIYQPSASPPPNMQQQAYQVPPNVQQQPYQPQPNIQQQPYQPQLNVPQQPYQPQLNVPQQPYQPQLNVQQQPYQPPQNIQEMSGNSSPNIQQQPYQPPPPNVQQQPYQPPANIQEMSGNAASVRPPRPSGGFDMSGAPMSEDYGHHELP